MKKILVIGMSENYAGMENFIINYYRYIDRTKIKFDFIVSTNKEIAFEKEIRKNNSTIYRIPKKRENYFKYKREVKKIFKKYGSEYDGIWMNACNIANIDYLILAKKYHIKNRILHAHASKPPKRKNWILNFIYNIKYKKNMSIQSRYVTHYWACSNEAASFFFNKSIYDKNAYTIITNGIDLDKYKYNDEIRKTKRKELGLSDNTFVIGHVGRFSIEKNHEYLINLFEQIYIKNKNSVLILVGEGELEKDVKELVKKKTLEKNVIFLGKRADVHELYSAMDAFILPSKYEGLGFVLIEAQTSLLPCYASEGVPKEVKITNYMSFFKFDDDLRILANKIVEGKKRKNIKYTKEYDNYDIKKCAKKLEKIMENL